MIGPEITLDKLVADIDQQIEILTAIASDNAILNEQLRLIHEARELLLGQEMEISRLVELIDPDDFNDHTTLIERQQSDKE